MAPDVRRFRGARAALLLALAWVTAALPARAGGPTTVDTFSGGVNQGNWIFFDWPTYPTTGGNPGTYISGSWSTKLPQVVTGGPSIFTGDFRLRNVTAFGIDLITTSTGLTEARPVTFLMSTSSCSVFVVLPDGIPTPGGGWKSYDVSFDPQSTTLPAGWQVMGTCTDPNAAWNAVIQDVTGVAFFWGDPTAWSSYTSHDWVFGADNPRLTEVNTWVDLGGASPGIVGPTVLLGAGLLTPGSTVAVDLFKAVPGALAVAWLSIAPAAPVPALGGTVHALPWDIQVFTTVNSVGRVALSTTMPAAPSGLELTFQVVSQHPSVPSGLMISNAVRGTVP